MAQAKDADTTVAALEWDWDEVVEVRAYVRVRARKSPEYFEGWQDRKPEHLAAQVVYQAGGRSENMDGFADLIGDAYVMEVEVERAGIEPWGDS